jgi:hypothetical protein
MPDPTLCIFSVTNLAPKQHMPYLRQGCPTHGLSGRVMRPPGNTWKLCVRYTNYAIIQGVMYTPPTVILHLRSANHPTGYGPFQKKIWAPQFYSPQTLTMNDRRSQ